MINNLKSYQQELSYRKQIVGQLCTQCMDGIYTVSPKK